MRYTIEEVFNLLGEEALNIAELGPKQDRKSIEVEGFKVYTKSLRYATFYQKGCKCVSCGKEGEYFQLDPGDSPKRRHFNLYTADGTLMTKDHILPKKHGGKDIVDNMQTMCVYCNSLKGCKIPSASA
jgi:5-methylcytosine-specific restriction endonuclease McrA